MYRVSFPKSRDMALSIRANDCLTRGVLRCRAGFHAQVQRWGQEVWVPPGKSQKYRFFSNTGLDPLENDKAT